MTKRTELKLEEEIEMLHAQLDVKEAMIKNYTAEIETQRRQLAIAVEALSDYAESDDWELENEKYSYWSKKGLPYPWRIALKALEQIKELEND